MAIMQASGIHLSSGNRELIPDGSQIGGKGAGISVPDTRLGTLVNLCFSRMLLAKPLEPSLNKSAFAQTS